MFTMSYSKSYSHNIKTPCVGLRKVKEDRKDGNLGKDGKSVSKVSSSPDSNVRQRVLKEVGLTSTTFIGPVFLPNTTKNKSNIEETLSEFYKELEKIDTPYGAGYNPRNQDAGFIQPPVPSKTFTPKGIMDVSKGKVTSAKTDGYQKSSGQKQPSWPHWYQNQPYYPRGPRPGLEMNSVRAATAQNQRHYLQVPERPPNPRFNRPPLHFPPPSSAFPNPHNPPSHANHNWSGPGMTNQYQEESHIPAFSRFPPPGVCRLPSQGVYGDSPLHFDRDGWGRSSDTLSDNNVNVGWSRDGKEECSQWNENYNMHQRYDSENEQWDHRCQPPRSNNNNACDSSFVLILMRGLPGSGKSTLARELLSTGPSGLILSTDDYFAHRDGYCYEPEVLGAAHEWNQRRDFSQDSPLYILFTLRVFSNINEDECHLYPQELTSAKDALHDGRSPIIIDNTNVQAWEMKPYVRMALESGYKVDFCEPDTSWKFDPHELEKRNKHSVPQEKIAQMLDRFSFPISVDIVMNSQEPLHVNQRQRPEQPHRMRTEPDFH